MRHTRYKHYLRKDLMATTRNVILIGGGTGGHLFPALALAQLLRGICETTLVTDQRCSKFLPEGQVAEVLYIHPPRRGLWNRCLLAGSLLMSCLKMARLFFKLRPKAIIAFGGYPTIPGLVIARLYDVPIILHEQNSLLGKTNQYFARMASILALTFPNTARVPEGYRHKTMVTGNFVREEIRTAERKLSQFADRFTILVTAGSQGAESFYKIVPAAIALLHQQKPMLHITIHQQVRSEREKSDLTAFYSSIGVEANVQTFFTKILDQYLAADLLVCRAGASTIAELVTLNLPAVIIPLPTSADDHQLHNAKFIADGKAGWYFEEKGLTPVILANRLIELVDEPDLLLLAAQRLALLSTSTPDALILAIKKIINR